MFNPDVGEEEGEEAKQVGLRIYYVGIVFVVVVVQFRFLVD